MVTLKELSELPASVYPVLVPWTYPESTGPKHPLHEIFVWCRDNLKERVHFPRTSGVDVVLNSDHLPRPKADYDNPYHWTMYSKGWHNERALLLVLCESADDAMLLKMAWC